MTLLTEEATTKKRDASQYFCKEVMDAAVKQMKILHDDFQALSLSGDVTVRHPEAQISLHGESVEAVKNDKLQNLDGDKEMEDCCYTSNGQTKSFGK